MIRNQIYNLGLSLNHIVAEIDGVSRDLIDDVVFDLAQLSSLKILVRKKVKKELSRIKMRKRGSFSASTFISLLLRPLLEKGVVRNFFGFQLALAVVVVGNQSNIDRALATQITNQRDPHQVLEMQLGNLQTLETDLHYLNPTASLIGISQYYQIGHPALDLRAPVGSDVIAIDKGKVDQVIYQATGYGHHVYVTHPNGITTLFAHLGKILVKPGDEVFSGQKIGEIGMTGWTTGPHLHFEMMSGGTKINPLLYLKPALEQWRLNTLKN